MRKTLFPFDVSLDACREWPTVARARSEFDPRPPERIDPAYDYTDPLAKMFEDYDVDWIAGFSQVGNTEFMVIVQQQRGRAIGRPTYLAKRFVWWGWGSLALASILARGVVWYRSRRGIGHQ